MSTDKLGPVLRDDKTLEWTVVEGQDKRWPNSYSVTVYHPGSGQRAWAMRTTESAAKDMALKRLNYYIELRW